MQRRCPERLVLTCRTQGELTNCENLAFAFARDVGLRGVDVWDVAACATMLGSHVLERGGGELELSIVVLPRPALQLQVRHDGPALAGLSAELRAARRYSNELSVQWHAGAGLTITARKWLRGSP